MSGSKEGGRCGVEWRIGIALAVALTVLQVALFFRVKPDAGGRVPSEARPPVLEGGPPGRPPITELFFSDIAAGIVALDARSELRLTREQALRLAPLVERAGEAYIEKGRGEALCRAVLTPAQTEFLARRRGTAPPVLTTLHDGAEDPHVAYARRVLAPKLGRAGGAKASISPGASWSAQGLTYMDICLGVEALERAGELALTPRQARSLMASLSEVGARNMKLREVVREIIPCLTRGQIEYIQNNQSTFPALLASLPSPRGGGDSLLDAFCGVVRTRAAATP